MYRYIIIHNSKGLVYNTYSRTVYSNETVTVFIISYWIYLHKSYTWVYKEQKT